ncbi:hypothetical protein [Carboxylicivirga sp. RSCT41]|uniref:hypothetical protein n=1 Tax=Carboxylicivirga agarovorans TaxID=3417570 RepID=UPI003D32A364
MILLVLLVVKLFSLNLIFEKSIAPSLPTANESEWVCVKRSNGFRLFERWVKVNDTLFVRERKGEIIAGCSLSEAEHYLSDYTMISDWMKGIKSVKNISEDSSQLVHIIIHLPWPFANRDLIARYHFYKLTPGKSIVRLQSDEHMENPASKCIRITHYEASWSMEQIGDEQTKIVFITQSNEPPMFPEWIQEPVIKKLFTKNLLRLKERLSEI